MLKNSYYKEIEPLLLKHFESKDAMNLWLFCPNYLWSYFTPISLIVTGDERPLKWIKAK